MNCKDFHRHYIELLDADSGNLKVVDLTAHLEKCAGCAQFYNDITQTSAALQPSRIVSSSCNFKERIMNRIVVIKKLEREKTDQCQHIQRHFWKPVLTAVALLTLAVALLFSVLFKPAGSVYALEQTLEANRGVRSIHMQFEPAGRGIEELWAEFDEFGELLRLRMNFPNTEDGPKDVVWQEDKAAVWFKRKKGYVILKQKNMLEHLKMTAVRLDPKLIVEKLYEKQANGEVQIEIHEPSFKDEPITLRVNFNNLPDTWEVYKVDPETKLVTQREKYRLNRGEVECVGRIKYLEYNQPITPEIFTLSPPDDVLRVDETAQVIGLAKGDLTDEQIAVKVVRAFFEALIAKDYAKAGQLYGGIPASKMEEMLGRMNVSRIISIGEPTPHERTGSLRVPCEIAMEVEENNRREAQAFLEKLYEREANKEIRIKRQEPSARGEPIILTVTSDDSTSPPKIYEVDPATNHLLRMREVAEPLVRPVYSQPGRWQIIGGI